MRFSPFDPETLEDPYPFYAWLRREEPVYEVPGAGYFLVSRYADVRRVCSQPEVFSSRLAAVVRRDERGELKLVETA